MFSRHSSCLRRTTPGGLRAGGVILGLSALAVAASVGRGQAETGPGAVGVPRAAGSATENIAPPPKAADCLAAFNAVEPWVRRWEVPTEPVAIDPPGTAGVCVTLRLPGAAGRLLARAAVMSTPETKGSALWRAMKQAREEADGRLPLEKDATRGERLAEMAARVLIDIQFAGESVPLAGETLDDAAAQLNPGRDGVIARITGEGGGRSEAVFPASQLALNINPAKAIEVAIGQLKLPPIELKDLKAKAGLSLHRFAVSHLAQSGSGEGPEFLFRGGRVVPAGDVNGAGLRAFGGDLAGHIASHRWRGSADVYGLRGNYNPLTDVYAPPVAGAREQAVAALALGVWAGTPGITAQSRDDAALLAREILEKLTVVAKPEEDPLASAVDAAAWVIADAALPAMPAAATVDAEISARVDSFRARARGVVWGVFDPVAGWPGVKPEHAMVALAMVRSIGTDDQRAAASRAVRELFAKTSAGELPAYMPWLGWAEVGLAPDATAAVPAAEALRQHRDACRTFQLTADDVGRDNPDFAGGLVFSRAGAGLPTWQTLRPLAFLCTMLGDARLTSAEELAKEMSMVSASLRFARQLAADRSVGHMFREPARANGGVRAVLWEQTVSLDATSMALISVSETLKAAAARAK